MANTASGDHFTELIQNISIIAERYTGECCSRTVLIHHVYRGLNKTSQCAELLTSPSQSICDEIAFGLLEGQPWEKPEDHTSGVMGGSLGITCTRDVSHQMLQRSMTTRAHDYKALDKHGKELWDKVQG